MKLPSSQRGHFDAGPNMIPVVNIAMVVLIVFIIGVSFAGPEHFLQSNVPITQRGIGQTPPPAGWIPDEPLEIRVDTAGPDSFVARAGRIETGDAGQLAAELKQMHRRLNAAGQSSDQIQVIISPGRRVKYRFLVEVYQAALEAEFTKIAFATAH